MSVKQCMVLPLFFDPERMSLDSFCQTVAEIGYAAIEIMQPGEDLEEIVQTARANHTRLVEEGQ